LLQDVLVTGLVNGGVYAVAISVEAGTPSW